MGKWREVCTAVKVYTSVAEGLPVYLLYLPMYTMVLILIYSSATRYRVRVQQSTGDAGEERALLFLPSNNIQGTLIASSLLFLASRLSRLPLLILFFPLFPLSSLVVPRGPGDGTLERIESNSHFRYG